MRLGCVADAAWGHVFQGGHSGAGDLLHRHRVVVPWNGNEGWRVAVAIFGKLRDVEFEKYKRELLGQKLQGPALGCRRTIFLLV